MTNDDVLFLAENLPDVDVPDMDGDFNYAVSYNMREAERIAVSIRKVIASKEGMKEYLKGVQALREEYADKDPTGKPITTERPVKGGVQTLYAIPGLQNPNSPFNKAVEELKEKHKKDFEEEEKQMEFLQKENKQFKPLTVTRRQVPKGLSRRAMDAVFLFVEKPKK
jgi:hypothetical protein